MNRRYAPSLREAGWNPLVVLAVTVALLVPQASVQARPQDEASPPVAAPESAPAEDTPPDASPDREEGVSVILELKDGARILGRIRMDRVDLDTGYGTLSVPVGDIYSIRFGKRSDPDLMARIAGMIATLGSDDFDARSQATNELIELGVLVERELTRALESEDVEVKARARKILDAIASASPDDTEPVREEDEVVTARFTVRGMVNLDHFEIHTRFGPLAVPKKHVRSIEIQEAPSEQKEVRLASSVSAQGAFHDTGIEVRRGDEISIEARGSITLGNWGMNVGPDGVPNNRFMRNYPLGCLLMRIGDGPMLQVGSSWTQRAERRGSLKLAIAAPNQNNTGDFKVVVSVRRRLD